MSGQILLHPRPLVQYVSKIRVPRSPALGLRQGICAMSVESEQPNRMALPAEGAIAKPRQGFREDVGRRRLVVTGLTAPVVLTLGTRAAHAQGGNSGGSGTTSIKTTKKNK